MRSDPHCFVVPAYGESPYLRACLASLAGQTIKSPVVVATSTPFVGIEDLCNEYGAVVVRHSPNLGIGRDWNQALSAATGRLITIAHQDDLYIPTFVERLLNADGASRSSALYFCDAEEITYTGIPRVHDANNRVKRLIAGSAFLGRHTISGPVSKKVLFGFGNPIVCPTVSLNMSHSPDFRFREDLKTNMDWIAWIDLAASGSITRIREVLVQHRVHTESATSRCIDDGSRLAEDVMVFERMWPQVIAKVIARLYRRSYAGYSE